jgi:GNAT superfamily N-acetyltransferase
VLALEDGAPAATGALFADQGAGWLGFGATLPDFRRRGAQRALLAARIELAIAAGCDLVVTETGEPQPGRPDASYRNIVWSGFEPAYVRANLRAAV